LWEPGTDLRAWLFTIMHNQNVNEIRRAMRDDATVDLENCCAVLIATTDPTASRQLRELERALAQISEEQRQVILLVGLEGMSYEDAAAILSIPVGTIRSRLSRGREALRQLMDMEVKSTSAAAIRNVTAEQFAEAPLAAGDRAGRMISPGPFLVRLPSGYQAAEARSRHRPGRFLR